MANAATRLVQSIPSYILAIFRLHSVAPRGILGILQDTP